jgi:cobalt-zinc-cadmium resistance protein CzcA
VIGGILSSTLLTLLVLPILYRLAHRPDEEAEDVSAEPSHPEAPKPV